MRINVTKFAILVILVEIIVLYYSWRFISKFGSNPITLNITNNKITKPNSRHISKYVTVIIRSYEIQENDIILTVESFLNLFPNIKVLIVCDKQPYPPLELNFSNSTSKNVKLINLSVNLGVPFKKTYPLFKIKTKYVLFVPDSVKINNRQQIVNVFKEIVRNSNKIVVAPIGNVKTVKCLKTDLNIKEWTLKYSYINNITCDSVNGRHISMVETELLNKLSNAFIQPFPEALYIQTAAQNVKITYLINNLISDNRLVRSHHTQKRLQQIENDQQKQLYQLFSIKKVVQPNGEINWYGCNRDTPRCFGTVIENIPSYLYLGKWTPPCCLFNLRTVGRHVFEKLNDFGVRFWLDSQSLLGAMKFGDILPWDYVIEVGINRDDISRCEYLIKAKNKQFIDPKGFVWEKATEGDFFRVHLSKINRLYVNIYPFFSRNGTMTKDIWFTNQKNEFPDHYLHPMSNIEFIGRRVPSPNNIRDFLELKYGDNVDNIQFNDPRKVKKGT